MNTESIAAVMPALERDGDRLPALGLGTWELTGAACRRAVAAGLEMGYRHLDTAHAYNNEREVGEGMRDSAVPRDRIFLTTKLRMQDLDARNARLSCERSLDLLRTDYLDLLLIHWPEEGMPLESILRELAALRDEGRLRHLGVSNFPVPLVRQAMAAVDVTLFCNQIEFHPYHVPADNLDYCRREGVIVVAYSPLARGRAARDPRILRLAEKYGRTPAQIVLRWLVEQPGVAAIPKASGEEHLRENLAIFDFEPEPGDLAAVPAEDGDSPG